MKRFFTRQPAEPRTDTTPAGERQADGGAKPGALQRRRFARALLVSVPVAAAAVAAVVEPQPVQAAAATDTWKMEGNANVDGNDFLGTTTAKPLIVKTSNKERMRIREDGQVAIGTSPGGAQLAVFSGGGTAIRAETSAGAAASGLLGISLSRDVDTAGVRGAHLAGGDGLVGTSDTSVGGVAGHGTGVRGRADGGTGVIGQAVGGTGVIGEGKLGVRGVALNPTASDSYAGDFSGNVKVAGAVSVNGAANGSPIAIAGSSNTANGRGVSGFAAASTGQTIGVYGNAASTTGVGVYAEAMANTGATTGLYARVASPDGVALRAESIATGSGSGTTAIIKNVSKFGTALYAVSNSVALYAETREVDGLAAYFAGDIDVMGTNTIGSSVRKIDHPLDPANKVLSHAHVASPDMLSVYSGNAVTDARGLATVKLPAYVEALNRDFRYQLTVIGAFAQAIVARKVAGNQFTIQTDKPNVEVSWQLTGIQQDAFAEAHRVVAEVDKPAHERGLLIHAREHGAGEERSLHARRPRQE